MRILAKSILFILSKWDTSMYEFKLIGKILLYVPMMLNNILTQIFYFLLLPFVMLYVWGKEQIEPLFLIYELFKMTDYYGNR